jgi:hypothetical protein
METGDYKNNFVYRNISTRVNGTLEQKSFALRLLIHYVGDLHQPLHATARINPRYPKGDMGGNLFTLPEHMNVTNLHSLWDSILYKFTGTPKMPLDFNDWQALGKNVTEMESMFSFSADEWQVFNATKWAMESFDLTKYAVYSGVKEGNAPSAEYVSKNQYLIQRQIVLGGLRLANIIFNIFGYTKPLAFLQ